MDNNCNTDTTNESSQHRNMAKTTNVIGYSDPADAAEVCRDVERELLELLDQKNNILIYGSGCVGKTVLLKRLKNISRERLRREPLPLRARDYVSFDQLIGNITQTQAQGDQGTQWLTLIDDVSPQFIQEIGDRSSAGDGRGDNLVVCTIRRNDLSMNDFPHWRQLAVHRFTETEIGALIGVPGGITEQWAPGQLG